jgi:heptaprenylglyceryl phosphate synthase
MTKKEIANVVKQLRAKLDIENQLEDKLYAEIKKNTGTDRFFSLMNTLHNCQSNQYIIKKQIELTKLHKNYAGTDIKLTSIPKQF